jgi:hypothetical protein
MTATSVYTTAAEYYEKIDNTGASAMITITLTLKVGDVIEIEVTNANGIKVRPFSAGETIHPQAIQSPSNLQSTVVGSSLKIKKVTSTTFMVIEQIGTWTVV